MFKKLSVALLVGFSLITLSNFDTSAVKISAKIVPFGEISQNKIERSDFENILPIFRDYIKKIDGSFKKEREKQTKIYLNTISGEIYRRIHPIQCVHSREEKSLAKILCLDGKSAEKTQYCVQLSPGGTHGGDVPYLKVEYRDGTKIKLVPAEFKDKYNIKDEKNVTIAYVPCFDE